MNKNILIWKKKSGEFCLVFETLLKYFTLKFYFLSFFFFLYFFLRILPYFFILLFISLFWRVHTA